VPNACICLKVTLQLQAVHCQLTIVFFSWLLPCLVFLAVAAAAAGAVDSFLLKKQRQLGKLTAVHIGHDNKGMAPGGAAAGVAVARQLY
jgi:hypothetical protein